MKILIVNTSDIIGGAARAAYRLHRALLDCKVDSEMFVQNKNSDDYTVIVPSTRVQKFMGRICSILDSVPIRFYQNRTKTLFSPGWVNCGSLVDQINKINPDIVHLHWVCSGMINIEDIGKIKAPIVWSLHDMWAFTGGCHYDEGCAGYEKECGNCKVLGSNKEKDLSRKIFKRKQKVFAQKKDITLVGLSRWINECSKNSTLLKSKNHINLPNPIDTDIFKPLDKSLSRELWNLPKDKKLVLYGALGATSDPRKGFKELSEALHQLEKNDDIEFVVFGSSKPQDAPDFGFKTHYLGKLADDISLVSLYNAVDIMVVPSLQENLSNAIMESLACGTPVVGFDIGGNSDMIEHNRNGYLAKAFDKADIKNGIEWILNNEHYDELCIQAREKVVREFSQEVVAQKYIKLYEEILNG